ncbi:MAG: glycoside hydrolase family 28 protein [Phycisphaerae bacterium]|nr:glycoside hydrolase family 28 protein [Phycisphaerae bacterium]MDW8261279.1 glycoside hydrolase family 28 protein [Phycisphaerales bacterium]
MIFEITRFGAVGDGETRNTRQIQATIDAAAEAGGGTVVVPAGTFVTGAIELRSNITLHLEPGATLLGSGKPEDFPLWRSRWEGAADPSKTSQPGRRPLIGGEGLRNVAITGRGTLDGNGRWWWQNRTTMDPPDVRPTLIRLVDCFNVRIEGITATNSPSWTVTPLACDNVVVHGISVINPPDSPNTDGINPDSCRNVRISDCYVDVGDDCITIKSGKETDNRREYRPCENITITNCTLLHGHGGVVIGSEITGGVRNVAISNCVFIGTDRGIRIKARRGRGGVVEDLRVCNLVMEGVLCPIVVNLFYGCGAWGDARVTDTSPRPVDEGTPRFRRFRYSHITARNVKYAAAYILGLPEMFVEDLVLTDCSFYLDPHNTEAGQPAMASVCGRHCRAGVIARNADGLRLRNVDVHDQLGEPIVVEDSRNVVIARDAASG